MNALELQEFNKMKGVSFPIQKGFKLLREICKLNSEFDEWSGREVISIKGRLIKTAERAFGKLSKKDQQQALDLWRS